MIPTKSISESEKPFKWYGLFVWQKHPLCIAVQRNDIEEVKRLLRQEGENVNVGGGMPLKIACEKGYGEIVDIILDEWSVSCYPEHVFLAMIGGHVDICAAILKHDDIRIDWTRSGYQRVVDACIKKHPGKREMYRYMGEYFSAADKKIYL